MHNPFFAALTGAWSAATRSFAVATRPPASAKATPPPQTPRQAQAQRPAWRQYLLGFVIALISIYLHLYGAFDRAEYGLHNFNYEIRGPVPVHPDIAIVAIDDKSLKEIPEIYPWPRSYFARVVDTLKKAGAKAIVFDMVFSSPDRQDSKNDRLFSSIKRTLHGKGLEIMGFDQALDRLNVKNDDTFAASLKRARIAVLGRTLSYEHQQSVAGSLQIASLQEPIPLLRQAANLGRVDTPYDEDGQMRRAELVRAYGDQRHLTVEAQGLRLYDPARFRVVMERFSEGCYPKIVMTPNVADECSSNEFHFDYAGPPHTIPTYSFSETINNLVDAKLFKGKVVFVGATAAILHDNFPAPFLMGSPELLPGVEMHANQLNTMLTDRFISRVDPLWLSLAILVLCVGMQVLLLRIRPVRGAVACGSIILLYYIATLCGFIFSRVWIDQLAPMSALALVYVGTLFTHYRSEEAKKKQVQSMFGQFVSPDVVDEMVASGQKPQTGGHDEAVTIMFTDLAGFTMISENLSAERLVEIINQYLSAMTEEILKEAGTVDKYIGDAVMAFWGAPKPLPDHAKRACRAALKMQTRMKRLIEQWIAEGLNFEFGMRVGVNSGTCVVGFMGPESKLNYTLMGDPVNLASRLEPVNKQYGTDTCISEFTYEQLDGEFIVRELDSIRVKGKAKPVNIYELVAEQGQELDPKQVRFFETFALGLRSYKEQQWAKAILAFEQALLLNPKDYASMMYVGRCQEFQLSPPPADWDGVFVMTHK